MSTKIWKKIAKATLQIIGYGQLIFSLGNGLVPMQAIGLPILPSVLPTTRYIYLNTDVSRKAIIAEVIQDMPAEIYFTEIEIDELYDLLIQCNTNFLSQHQLIDKISNLRGGIVSMWQ